MRWFNNPARAAACGDQDNLNWLLNKHATTARAVCPELPYRLHTHQLRHARAMQMLRAGVPLPHIKEFLSHAKIATTSIYATAVNLMVREAIQKVAGTAPELKDYRPATTTPSCGGRTHMILPQDQWPELP